MRESVGSTWIFALAISFTLIFSGFLVLVLSYSKAYKLKNEMTSIIEKYEGITTNDKLNNKGSLSIINQYLYNSGYNAVGHCDVGSYGVDDLLSDTIVQITDANKNQDYYYCLKTNTSKSSCTTLFTITVFYDFNLPFFGQLKKYSISGQTNEIYKAYLNNIQIVC